MLKQHDGFFRKSLLVGDLFILAGVFYFLQHSPFFKGQSFFSSVSPYSPPSSIAVIYSGVSLIWIALLIRFQAYGHFRGSTLFHILIPVGRAIGIGTLFFGCWLVFVELDRSSRVMTLVTLSGINLVALSGLRIAIWLVLIGLRQQGLNFRNVLIVGAGPRGIRFQELISENPSWGLEVIGYLDWDRSKINKLISGKPILGHLDDLAKVLDESVVDEVVFLVPRSGLDSIQEAVTECEKRGVNVRIGADLFSLPLAKPHLTMFGEMPMVTYSTTIFPQGPMMVKRIIDIVLSALGLGLCLPIFVIIGLAVRTTPGPIFFKQERIGLHGRRFTLYKFRSMVANAHERLDEVRQMNEMDGPMFKAKADPRITTVGKFLRRWSLDELPQLFNVLRGEMSLVGPRPSLPSEVIHFTPWQKRRLSVRPGVTGLWQVSGRNTIDFERWMKLDLEYIDSWSLGLDWKIICLTVPVMINGKGAH